MRRLDRHLVNYALHTMDIIDALADQVDLGLILRGAAQGDDALVCRHLSIEGIRPVMKQQRRLDLGGD